MLPLTVIPKFLQPSSSEVSEKQIAEKRFVEEVTVRSIASKICSKFGIKPLKEVVRTFEQLKLIDLLDELIKER